MSYFGDNLGHWSITEWSYGKLVSVRSRLTKPNCGKNVANPVHLATHQWETFEFTNQGSNINQTENLNSTYGVWKTEGYSHNNFIHTKSTKTSKATDPIR